MNMYTDSAMFSNFRTELQNEVITVKHLTKEDFEKATKNSCAQKWNAQMGVSQC